MGGIALRAEVVCHAVTHPSGHPAKGARGFSADRCSEESRERRLTDPCPAHLVPVPPSRLTILAHLTVEEELSLPASHLEIARIGGSATRTSKA